MACIYLTSAIGCVWRPLLFRGWYIEYVSMIALPDSARIVSYRFRAGPFGIEPFFARIAIESDTVEPVMRSLSAPRNLEHELELINSAHFSRLINFEDVEIIGTAERMRPIYRIGTSRTARRSIYVIVTRDASGNYFLYVLY